MQTPDERLCWLLQCAGRLAAPQDSRLSVRRLLAELDITLAKRVDPNAKPGSGAMRSTVNGYEVILTRRTCEEAPLSPRERFTIAHELAHVLLHKRFQWFPIIRSDYQLCEDWCNLFASCLLIPDAAAQRCDVSSPTAALRALDAISIKYGVSRQAAAKKIAANRPNVGFFSGVKVQNSFGEPVIKLWWGVSSIAAIHLAPALHLKRDNPVGRALLSHEVSEAGRARFSTSFQGIAKATGIIRGASVRMALVN